MINVHYFIRMLSSPLNLCATILCSFGLIAPAGINMATLAGSLGNSPGSNQVLAVAAVQDRVRTSNVPLDGMNDCE